MIHGKNMFHAEKDIFHAAGGFFEEFLID